ncbi:M56 family metallopeptidase [Robertkochia aurantiaca]|uniref:M56 family metallopeptidase n=1 Tax=Robertkochia aurantiaca TaxID=2873700 RepID=UPI001CCD7231|nr:M56 family metallopeptidase [Robertkochia sp. 3YJGBD-33]
MEPLYYLIWTSVSLCLFYAAYKLIFTDQTPPWAHRGYLLVTLIASVLLPFQPFRFGTILESMPVPTGITSLPEMTPLARESVNTSASGTLSAETIFLTLYVIISAFLIVRIFWRLNSLFILRKRSEMQSHGELTLLVHPEIKAPFSFFHYVFIPEKLNEGTERDQIIAHERVHAVQYHSADILLTEIFIALFWFHPLAWFIKGKITLIHEYLADQGVLKTGANKAAYQALLINQIAEGRLIGLSSNFNHSLIKKRIIMMSNSNVNAKSGIKILALIPVVLTLLIAIACNTTDNDQKVTDFKGLETKNATFVVNGKTVSKDYVDKMNDEEIATVTISGGEKGDVVAIVTKSEIKTPEKFSFENARKLYVVDGEVQDDTFDMSAIGEENIRSVNIIGVEDEIKKYTDKDYDRVVIITTR